MAAGERKVVTESEIVRRLVVSSIAWLGLLVGNIYDVNATSPQKPASKYKAADAETNANPKRIEWLPACAKRSWRRIDA